MTKRTQMNAAQIVRRLARAGGAANVFNDRLANGNRSIKVPRFRFDNAWHHATARVLWHHGFAAKVVLTPAGVYRIHVTQYALT